MSLLLAHLLYPCADILLPDWNDGIQDGCTPLHVAVEMLYVPVVELLLAKGAKIEAKTKVCAAPFYIIAVNYNVHSPFR